MFVSAWRIFLVISTTQCISHHISHRRRPCHPRASSTACWLSWQSFPSENLAATLFPYIQIRRHTAHSKMSYTTRISRIGLRSAHDYSFPRSPATFRPFSSTSHTRLEVFAPRAKMPTRSKSRQFLAQSVHIHIDTNFPALQHGAMKCTPNRQCSMCRLRIGPTKDFSDWVVLGMVRLLRWGADKATGYRHDPSKPYAMSERKWMVRFIFLETVAGVPGMVGGMLKTSHESAAYAEGQWMVWWHSETAL